MESKHRVPLFVGLILHIVDIFNYPYKSYNILEINLLWSTLAGYLVGSSYAFLWFGSILLGFYFLYAPCLLILPFSRRLYRKITDTLYSSWEAFNVVSLIIWLSWFDLLVEMFLLFHIEYSCIDTWYPATFSNIISESPSDLLRSQDSTHRR